LIEALTIANRLVALPFFSVALNRRLVAFFAISGVSQLKREIIASIVSLFITIFLSKLCQFGIEKSLSVNKEKW